MGFLPVEQITVGFSHAKMEPYGTVNSANAVGSL
jgi:hypothetical protein